MVEKETNRVHRLALPLIVKRKGSSIIISDGVFGHEYDFKDFGQLKVTSVDQDGFVTFELAVPQQEPAYQTTIPISLSGLHSSVKIVKARPTEAGFVLVGSGTAKSASGSSTSRGTYDYYKRPTDESYYTMYRLGSKTKRIRLGSLQDASSHIRQIFRAIRSLPEDRLFDRKMLIQMLPFPALKHGQKLKSVLDILVIEGYLERREAQRYGKIHEEYKKTPKILSIQ